MCSALERSASHVAVVLSAVSSEISVRDDDDDDVGHRRRETGRRLSGVLTGVRVSVMSRRLERLNGDGDDVDSGDGDDVLPRDFRFERLRFVADAPDLRSISLLTAVDANARINIVVLSV